jgi:hypothetical protein
MDDPRDLSKERFMTQIEVVSSYLLLQAADADPESAFGKVVREFACVMSVPAYFVQLIGNETQVRRLMPACVDVSPAGIDAKTT